MVFSRSARMRVQLIPLRLSRVLRKTLSSSTWAFSGLRMTASKSACCLPAAASSAWRWVTSLRRSANCALSALASMTSAASVATNSTPMASDAANMARSLRKGWLARLMGIFISLGSIVSCDGPQIPQQSRVVLPWDAQRRPERFHFHVQLLGEAALRLGGGGAKSAEQQLLGAATQVVFDVDEGGRQYGGDVLQIGRGQFQAAHQLELNFVAHYHGEHTPGELRQHAEPGLGRQFQGRQTGSGDHAGIHARGAERRFIARNNLQRGHHHRSEEHTSELQ